jgi:hypothetical protein
MVVVGVVVGGAVEHTGGRVDLMQVVACVAEAREGTVVEVAVVGVGHSGDGVIVPRQVARLHGGLEPAEHLDFGLE